MSPAHPPLPTSPPPHYPHTPHHTHHTHLVMPSDMMLMATGSARSASVPARRLGSGLAPCTRGWGGGGEGVWVCAWEGWGAIAWGARPARRLNRHCPYTPPRPTTPASHHRLPIIQGGATEGRQRQRHMGKLGAVAPSPGAAGHCGASAGEARAHPPPTPRRAVAAHRARPPALAAPPPPKGGGGAEVGHCRQRVGVDGRGSAAPNPTPHPQQGGGGGGEGAAAAAAAAAPA